MAIQNEPSRITIPFAASGTKNTIPDTQPSPSASQAASWTDGFPAQCSLPLSAGGIPPARADFNGIFNAITQSERFTQEGGVWLWSNAVDYAASRMVLGSDGKLYWSAAQSGPNVGGAVDPTTDNGAYWVRLPSMADIAAQGYATQAWVASQNYATQGWVGSLGYATQTWVGNQGYATQVWVTGQNYATQGWVGSQGYATQAWVKTTAVAPIYIDSSKPAGNNGTTPATAVKTFAEAISIAKQNQKQGCYFIVAGGTYSEEVTLSKLNCQIEVAGNITISGGIYVYIDSNINCSGSSYTITTSNIHIDSRSSFTTNMNVVIAGASGVVPLEVTASSYFLCTANCSITATSSYQTVAITYGATVTINGSLTCTSNSVSAASIRLYMNSNLYLGGDITINGTSTVNGIRLDGGCKLSCVNITVNDIVTTGCGLLVENGSLIIVGGIATVYGGTNAPATHINNGSFANIVQLVSYGKWNGDGSALFINIGSNVKTVHLDTRSLVSCGAVLAVARVSSLEITNFSNTCTAPNTVSGGGVLCSENGVVRFLSGNTYGSINGQKYYLYGGGKIFLGGATDARLPGTGGFCESSSFAFIGR